MHQGVLNLLIELLKIRSISNDIDRLIEIVNFVDSYFSLFENRIVKRFTFNEKPSIVIQNFEGLEADIILCGYLDVVPSTESGQFDPIIKDGKIYARGAGDMKSGVAIMMVIMKEILSKNYKDKKVTLILTCDQKVGGIDGVKKILEKGYTGKIALIPSNGDNNSIVYAEKGIVSMKIKVSGKSSHSSKSWLGENAILKVFNIYNELKNYIQEDSLLYSEEHWSSSVNLTIINSGTANNVIPSTAEAGFDIRLTEKFFDIEKLIGFIKEVVNKNSGEIISILSGDVLFTDINEVNFQRYLDSFRNITGREPSLNKEHGASDGRYFGAKKIPTILHRPTCKDINSKGEYVEEEALYEIYEIYRHFVFN